MHLDHTIVPARDKVVSARFIAGILGAQMKPDPGHFAQVRIGDTLTLDFADEVEQWGGPGFDPRMGHSNHYAFVASEDEYRQILEGLKKEGVAFGSGPFRHSDGLEYTARGGRGVYFEDPAGNVFEVMTVPETGYEGTFEQTPPV